jgi:hypothetical protein
LILFFPNVEQQALHCLLLLVASHEEFLGSRSLGCLNLPKQICHLVRRSEGIEQNSRFSSSNFAQMIRSGRQRRADFKRSSKGMRALKVSVWHSAARTLSFWMRKLSRILDNHDPFAVGNPLRKNIQESRLSGSSSATDQDGFAIADLCS